MESYSMPKREGKQHTSVQKIVLYTLVLLSLFNGISPKAYSTCSSYYLGKDVPSNKQPAFLEAYTYLREAYGTQKKEDFNKYIAGLKIASQELQERECWEGYYLGMLTLAASYTSMSVYENEFTKAKYFTDQILQSDTSILPVYHKFRAGAYYYLAQYYYKSYQADSAIRNFEKCIKVNRDNISRSGIQISLAYFGLAQSYLHLKYNPQEAENNFGKFLSIRKHPDYSPDTQSSNYHAYYQLEGYKDFAESYYLLSDYDKAISYAYRFRDSVHIYPLNEGLQKIRASQLLAEILLRKGMLTQAEKYFKETQNLIKNSPEYFDQNRSISIKNLLGMSKAQEMLGFPQKSKTYILTALEYLSQDSLPGFLGLKADVFSQLGRLSIKTKNFEVAKKYLNKSNGILLGLTLDTRAQRAQNYLGLSEVEKHTQNLCYSLELIEKSFRLISTENTLTSKNFRGLSLRLSIYKGDLLYKIAREDSFDIEKYYAAIEEYQRASESLNQHLFELERESSLLELKQSSYGLFESALSCIWDAYIIDPQENLVNKAYQIMESSKALSLSWKLDKINDQNQGSIHQLSNKRNIVKRLAFYQAELSKLDESAKFYEERFANIMQKILELEEDLKEIDKDLIKNPGKNKSAKKSIQLTSLIKFLYQENIDNFYSFFWGKKALYRFSVTHKNQLLFKKIESIDSISTQILNTHRILANHQRNSGQKQLEHEYDIFSRNSHSLFQSLLGTEHPLNSLAAKTEKMLILPDGLLNMIPFELLLVHKAPKYFSGFNELAYLVKLREISYAPSIGYLTKESSQSPKPVHAEVLAFSYTGQTVVPQQGLIAAKRGEKLIDLPGSFAELQSISNYFDGSFHLGEFAKKEIFLSKAPDYTALHLSLHGRWDSLDIPYLVFPPNKEHPKGELLYSYELAGINLQSKLAILSACQSGLGNYISGEGMQSMAQSFLSSGCNSVMFSLWEIDDEITSTIMDKFYKNMSTNMELDRAISDSKRHFLKNSDPYSAHPANWSGFILFGKKEPLNLKEKGFFTKNFLLISITLLLSLAIFSFRKRIHRP